MKTSHLILGGLALGGVAIYFYHNKQNPITKGINDAFTNSKGYTNMMKLSPDYYNTTSMEGAADYTNSFNGLSIVDTWGLPAEQGNAMQVNAGWTDVPDTYSARVSNSWLQGEAQGAHL